MLGSYSFSNSYGSSNFVSQTQFSPGFGVGIDFTAQHWAQGASFHFDNNQVSIVPVALRAGQTIALDLDFGIGGIDNIDTRITIINSSGTAVSTISSSAGLDYGTTSAADPLGTYTAAVTGMYFIAVSHQVNGYVNNTFTFGNGGTDGGDFLLNLGFSSLTPLILGTSGADIVTLGLTDLRYDARGGDDSIQASTNGTTIDGGAGNDSLFGAAGADILSGGDGDDYLGGIGGNDVLAGGGGNDSAFGGLGNDEIFGGQSSDNLFGEDGNDLIHGEEDNDNLYGGNHHDKLYGGIGNDNLDGDLGNDLLDGGAGNDTGNYSGAISNTNVNLNLAGPQNTGMGLDTLIGIDGLIGGIFQDTLTGNDQTNFLYGGNGNDTLSGNGAYDQLFGQAGNDTLRGGSGDDFIAGDDGLDHLFGGTGRDSFNYFNIGDSTIAAPDRIYDFSNAEADRIGLQGVNPGTLIFLGAGLFTGTAAEVRVVTAGAFQGVYVDNDGNGVADMRFFVQSTTTLVATDFFL